MVKGVVNYSFIYFTVFTANDRADLQNSKQKRRPSRLRLIAPEPSGPATARVKHKLAFFMHPLLKTIKFKLQMI